MRSRFHSGSYTNKEEINRILLHPFNFYSKKFDIIIPKIASCNLIEFLLFEFDQASEIQEKYKHGKLNQEETEKWIQLGPTFRRSAKFLAERVVMLQPDEAPEAPEDSLMEFLDEIWISAEEMVKLYILSDQTFMIFPNETTLKIHPKKQVPIWENFLDLEVNNKCNFDKVRELVRRDTINCSSILGEEL